MINWRRRNENATVIFYGKFKLYVDKTFMMPKKLIYGNWADLVCYYTIFFNPVSSKKIRYTSSPYIHPMPDNA